MRVTPVVRPEPDVGRLIGLVLGLAEAHSVGAADDTERWEPQHATVEHDGHPL